MNAKKDGPAMPKIAFAEIGEQDVPEAEDKDEIAATPDVDVAPEPTIPKPEDLTTDQLRYLLEQRLIKEAKEAAANQKKIDPPNKAPKGMVWTFNRTPKPFEWQKDGVVYEIGGHDMMCLPELIAKHGKKRSILSLDPVANTAIFKLALEGEEKFGVPLTVVNRIELLDRSTDANPLGWGSPVPTHPAVIRIGGAAEMMTRRPNSFVELE